MKCHLCYLSACGSVPAAFHEDIYDFEMKVMYSCQFVPDNWIIRSKRGGGREGGGDETQRFMCAAGMATLLLKVLHVFAKNQHSIAFS